MWSVVYILIWFMYDEELRCACLFCNLYVGKNNFRRYLFFFFHHLLLVLWFFIILQEMSRIACESFYKYLLQHYRCNISFSFPTTLHRFISKNRYSLNRKSVPHRSFACPSPFSQGGYLEHLPQYSSQTQWAWWAQTK